MIFSYHPLLFFHFKKIADRYPNDPISQKIKKFDFYHKENNQLYWLGKFMKNRTPVDRTGRLNLIDVKYLPISKIKYSFNKSFDEVCHSTAVNYWNDNNDITVLWSGGLDSTCVAVSLLQTKPENKKLTFLGSIESIEEYPSFYEQHKNMIKIVTPEQFWNTFTYHQTDTKYVTGDIGDQIFGGIIDEFGNKKDLPWQNFIEWENIFSQKYFNNPELKRNWTREEKNKFIGSCEIFNKKAPFKIITLFDFVWWLTFSTRMNGAANNITVLSSEVTKVKQAAINTYSPFFFNEDFEQWSMINHHLKYPAGIETYKQPIKNFIIKYNNDVDFLSNKRKEKSTPRLLGEKKWFQNWGNNKNTNYLIMTDGTIYSPENEIPFDLMKSLLKI
jgi:hypothetical protein